MKSYHSLNRLRFEAKDIELDELGFVIDRRVFTQVLFDEVKQSKNISLHNESIINKLGNNKKNEFFGVYLDSTMSKKLLTKYLIISDGAESSLKNFLDIKSKEIDYSQTSFVFNANASFESSTAIQIFNKYGIFAMIPYAENKINLILTINNKYTSSFVGRNKQIDDMRIKEIFKNYINNLDSCNYVSEYNLITSRTHEIARKNILLLGNSSQLLHPVGAQGFNLAIRHIEMLMDHIKSENLDMLSLSKDIDKSRLDTFDHIDLATKILANDKIPSMLMTFGIINTVKSSRLLRNIFLKKILGLEGYAYLTVGSKA
ncbi:MAG: 2-octaprenyl-6-methoxyphenol hydroxylase [Gammaproteobacteria bacterium]|nr:MAG: 2-octaprenyl-6-methoxyphenol hydroxylase [Gammaproteobacteria bacterium]